MAGNRSTGTMTDGHKAALAVGRNEGRIVRNYLEALRANKPRPGRKRTVETVQRRLEAVDKELFDADPLSELLLVQERLDLQAELEAFGQRVDAKEFEAEFIRVAKSYGARKRVTYAAWREVGVTPAVLKAAGISRAD
jgi:hypothetical protein